MISHPALPDTLISCCLDILSKISDSERDLIRVIVDVVTELRAGSEDENMVSLAAYTVRSHSKRIDGTQSLNTEICALLAS